MSIDNFFGFTYWGCMQLGEELAKAPSPATRQLWAKIIRECLGGVPPKWRPKAYELVFTAMRVELATGGKP